MANKVDPNRNENTYNPDQPYLQKPENLPKSKRKAKSK
jgi:hypothetical protein